MVKALAAFILILPLAGCSSFGLGLPCSVGPIKPDAGASKRWTRSEKEQVTTLNEAGETLCGWRP